MNNNAKLAAMTNINNSPSSHSSTWSPPPRHFRARSTSLSKPPSCPPAAATSPPRFNHPPLVHRGRLLYRFPSHELLQICMCISSKSDYLPRFNHLRLELLSFSGKVEFWDWSFGVGAVSF
ncbi:hypothetical protein ACFX2C_017322 [Malus domestica]